METAKRRALGRGLEELFNNEPMDIEKVEERILETTTKDEIIEVNLTDLRSNPYQPRQIFDTEKLEELAESIKKFGVIQPIIIKKSIKGYEIIAGERRVKASLLAGKTTIPVVIRDFDDADMMQIALLENLQRENLNVLEEADAYKSIIEKLEITQEELGKRLGKSRSHITNMLGLLTLPDEVQKSLGNKEISMGHARIISKLENKEQQINLAKKVSDDELSVRQLEELTKSNERFIRTHEISKKSRPSSTDYEYIQEELCEKLGTKVRITSNKIEISFVNGNDLNRLLEIMNLETRG